MSFQMKVIGFICLCLGMSFCTRFLPMAKITNAETPVIVSEDIAPSLTAPNLALLQQQYTQRPIFVSKFDETLKTTAPKSQPVHAWSPLDYDLIGVSRANKQRTGWFKHNELGTLVSARLGTQLGDWTLNQLSTTEAVLENNGEKLSLKLFIGKEPR